MFVKPEIQRLKQVYQSYRLNPAKQIQWSLANPGNRLILKERRKSTYQMLRQFRILPLADKRILEIGCGDGQVLAEFLAWGARPENLHGVDLLPERIERAKRHHPALQFECTNAERLHYSASLFDLVVCFTVFSSILDETLKARVAAEAARVLKDGGAILWYDFRYHNPANPHVRGIMKNDLRRLFPAFVPSFQTITLLPPLARRLGKFTSRLYPILARIAFLRTHYLVVMLNI